MGSFAYNLHVKSNDAQEVLSTIRELFLEQNYQTTDAELGEEAMWGMDSSIRGLHVSDSQNGWVAVLDSDLMGSGELGCELSARLSTYAINFMVNDSDFWHYQLFHCGNQIDEHTSRLPEELEGLMDVAEDDSAGLAEMLMGGGVLGLPANFAELVEQAQESFLAQMPPEIEEIHNRIQQGTASPEEVQQYTAWTQAMMLQLLGNLGQGMPNVSSEEPDSTSEPPATLPFPGVSQERPEPSESDLGPLQPLLQPNVSEADLREALERRAVFAEQALAEFLPLIGISSEFAYLSYRYLEEFTPEQLAEANVRLNEELRFRAGSV